MNDFPGVDRIRVIGLRWTLRDIKAKRTTFPINPEHLSTLVELGFAEMMEDVPAITKSGYQILD